MTWKKCDSIKGIQIGTGLLKQLEHNCGRTIKIMDFSVTETDPRSGPGTTRASHVIALRDMIDKAAKLL